MFLRNKILDNIPLINFWMVQTQTLTALSAISLFAAGLLRIYGQPFYFLGCALFSIATGVLAIASRMSDYDDPT